MATSQRLGPLRRQPFLPPSIAHFLARRLAGLLGVFLVVSGFLLAVALLSHTASDPSWNHATAPGAPIGNVMGLAGARVADMLLQLVGVAAGAPAVLLIMVGLLIIGGRSVVRLSIRALLIPVVTLLLAIALAQMPAGEYWPMWQPRLGGAIGDLLMEWLTSVVPEWLASPDQIATMSSVGFLVFGLLCADITPTVCLNIWRGAHRYGHATLTAGRTKLAAVRFVLTLIQSFFQTLTSRNAGGKGQRHNQSEGRSANASSPTVRVAPRFDTNLTLTPSAPSQEMQTLRAIAATGPLQPAAQEAADPLAVWEPSLAVAGEYAGGTPPPLNLLQEPDQEARRSGPDEAMLKQDVALLQRVLSDFGVRGAIVNARSGPVVTLFELEPAPGTKSSRVIGLADDIARSMSAVSARVAVVPGRNIIGIELPNPLREIVYLRELLERPAYQGSAARLPLVLGCDIAGAPVVTDLARMPHLLVAGTTGSGKSVAINTMVLSLIYRLSAEKCRFIMIDPKMLELSAYEGIPHLLSPVVTDPKKAVTALKWAAREMKRRYLAMSRLGVRNIEGYNARLKLARSKGVQVIRKMQTGFDTETGRPVFEEDDTISLIDLPYIVVIVDEMADLMLIAGKDIEATVQQLAQMARAAGIHLIMATQRPSVDVITGTIKANFPTRISFQVASRIDSRTILGDGGAEQLLGQGDMLYMASGGRISRVHGPFVRDAEVEAVVSFLKTQGEPSYVDAVLEDEEETGSARAFAENGANHVTESEDALYDQAVAIILRDRKASTSYIQRKLRIGYNSAARLIERMEAEGMVSGANHAGRREVLAGSAASLIPHKRD